MPSVPVVRDYLHDQRGPPEEQLYKSMIALILRSAAKPAPNVSHAGLAGAGQLCPHQQALHRGPELALAAEKTQLSKSSKGDLPADHPLRRMNWA